MRPIGKSTATPPRRRVAKEIESVDGSLEMTGTDRVLVDSDGLDLVDHLMSEWAKECPDLDTGAMPVVGRFIMIGRALEARTNAALKPFDLNYSDFDVLATLRRSGAPYELTPKRLMSSVLLTSGAMTALLDRLKRRNLITRGTDPADGRVKTARLTITGRHVIDQAIVARFADAKVAASLVAGSNRSQLESILRDFVAKLNECAESPSA
jgi:DNA-binding MarR family transcriptional regulator